MDYTDSQKAAIMHHAREIVETFMEAGMLGIDHTNNEEIEDALLHFFSETLNECKEDPERLAKIEQEYRQHLQETYIFQMPHQVGIC